MILAPQPVSSEILKLLQILVKVKLHILEPNEHEVVVITQLPVVLRNKLEINSTIVQQKNKSLQHKLESLLRSCQDEQSIPMISFLGYPMFIDLGMLWKFLLLTKTMVVKHVVQNEI